MEFSTQTQIKFCFQAFFSKNWPNNLKLVLNLFICYMDNNL